MTKRQEGKTKDVDESVSEVAGILKNDGKLQKKKARKREVDDVGAEKIDAKKKKKSPRVEKAPVPSKGVQLDSLQSIFATKGELDGVFSLFGGESPLEELSEQQQSSSIQSPVFQTAASRQSERKQLYFFPHFDFPEKNALSLFPNSEELFYHNRSE
jgi:hypothetical protein